MMKRYPKNLTVQEESVLFDRLESDDIKKNDREIIREKLVLHNMRFVVFFVKKNYSFSDVPMEDLVQEGCLALYKALDTYKRGKGCQRFISWAKWWIRAYINDLLDKNLTIRIPSSLHTKMRKLNKMKATAEIAEEDLVRASKSLGRSEEESKRILSGYKMPISLFTLLGNGESKSVLMDVLVDKKAENAEEMLNLVRRKEILKELMKNLSKNERKTLRLKWGLGNDSDNEEQTFEGVGKKLGVSKQRVHQVETAAFKKMRESVFFHKLICDGEKGGEKNNIFSSP